jgi:hypothetical protein
MNRDQDNIQVSRYAAQVNQLSKTVKSLQQQNAKLARERKRESIERRLIQLQAEGYDFNRVKHIDRFMRLSDEEIDGEIENIRENYSRSPVGRPMVLSLNDTIDVGRNGLPDQPAMADQSEIMRKNGEQLFGSSVLNFARSNGLEVDVDGVSRHSKKGSVYLVDVIDRYQASKKPKQTA